MEIQAFERSWSLKFSMPAVQIMSASSTSAQSSSFSSSASSSSSGSASSAVDKNSASDEKKGERKLTHEERRKEFDLPTLPIHAVRDAILDIVAKNQIIVLVGDTVSPHFPRVLAQLCLQGSGKSTQLSQFLYEAGYGKDGLIGVTQPRRIGAVSVAKRVAKELDVELGQEVGYAIRNLAKGFAFS